MRTEKKASSLSIAEIRHMARAGQLGNLKLLVLSLAILFLCVVGLIVIRGHSPDTKSVAGNATAEMTADVPAAQAIDSVVEEEQIGVSGGATPTRHEAGGTAPVTRTDEERERLYEEMGKHIPPGEVLTY